MINIFWFRRDLRLEDNTGLFHALKEGLPVLPIFIFDRNILDALEDKADRRVAFIHAALTEMQAALTGMGSSMEVHYGFPAEVFQQLSEKYLIAKVFTNHDYEPYAKQRDEQIRAVLSKTNTTLHTFKDQVIFEKDEVTKDDGKTYTVFTPYSKRWRATLQDKDLAAYPTEKYFSAFYQQAAVAIPSLKMMGFTSAGKNFPSKELDEAIIVKYDTQRNYPAINGTSRLGVHLRFGTISIRALAAKARSMNDVFLSELIWRDFYHAILWHFPQVVGNAFKPEYDKIEWRQNEEDFEKWCKGQTGYPIVDAGMRELNETGFMHNRVRMIVASFLTKHLLIDWRRGEAYFAKQLLDFDLAANNGGWQWAAGSGCDAAPYFRIFSPARQTETFDKALQYISKWVPEFQEFHYVKPMVDHDFARKRCMEVYGKALKK
jgi:deoxyribodipyrimidine photo-lyase